MADKKDVISYGEYQKLSEEEKQNYEPNWKSDGKSGIATRKGAKLPKVKSTIPVTEMEVAKPDKTKTVLSRKEAAKAGIKTGGLPTQFELEHPALSGSNRNVSDENGWIDNDENVHLNSRTNEARSKAAESDTAAGRDYKTAKAPSAAQLDLRNAKFDAKDYKGNYVYSFDELVKLRDKYKAEGDDVWKKLQEKINRHPEGQAQIAAKKKAAADAEAKRKAEEEEAAKKKEEESKTGGSSRETESALKDTKAEDEALDKKQEALDKVLDKAKTRREELDEEWDELLKKNEAELDKHKDAADLADFLPRFAIQHYLEGNFGERKSAKALGTLGYFLLDKIGASMVNASQVARGMSPTQKTALEQYNTKMMEAAINRDDKNRSKINEEKINTIIKNSDALRQAGYATEITLGNDMVSKYLSQHADQIDEQVYLKLKKQAADWYDTLSDSEKMSVDRLFLAISTNPSDRQKGILQYQLKGYEAAAQEDAARAEKARYEQEEAKQKTKTIERLTRAQAARAEQEIENMKKNGMLTEAQTADAWKAVDIHQKDLDWRDAQEFQKQITGYLGAASNFIPFLINDSNK